MEFPWVLFVQMLYWNLCQSREIMTLYPDLDTDLIKIV